MYLFSNAIVLALGAQIISSWSLSTTWVRVQSDSTPIVEIRLPARAVQVFYLLKGAVDVFVERVKHHTVGGKRTVTMDGSAGSLRRPLKGGGSSSAATDSPMLPSRRLYSRRQAVFTFDDGAEYKGEWLDAMFDGKGTLQTALATFEGHFKLGVRQGFGTLRMKSAAEAAEAANALSAALAQGSASAGAAFGSGAANVHGETSSGRIKSVYIDTLKHSAASGSSGATYAGNWKADQKDGRGELRYAASHPLCERYVGEWKRDKRTGRGVLSYKAGR